MKAETITSTVRLVVVKPLDGDWDALGRTLRALRAPLHRVLNGTVCELEVKRSGPCWAPTPGDIEKRRDACHPRTASYRLVGALWDQERAAAAQRVAAKKAYAGDEVIVETKPTSAVQLGVAGAAFARWGKFDKERWKGTTSLPSFRQHSPIYVAGQGVRLYDEDGSVVLELNLITGGRTRLVVQACDGSGFAKLRRLLDNTDGVGDVRLIEDDDRRAGKRKWFAMAAFTEVRPEPRAGKTMAVHRGIRSFLTCAIERSDPQRRDAFTTVLETGDDILRHKAAYAARRRSLGQQGRQLGAGAKGHGIDRRHERITRIEDAEARWVRTKCQEVAAHLLRIAERHGVGRILLEDWTNPAKDGAPELGSYVEYMVRSFPLAELRAAVEWSAQKRGYAIDIVRTEHNSRDCPACEHRHEEAQRGIFMCAKCKLERNVDVVFAWNMLKRDGKTPGIEETRAANKRAAAKLRGASKKAAKAA